MNTKPKTNMDQTNQNTKDGGGDAPAPSNAFTRILQVHGRGEIANELGEALQKAVEAVAMTGKPSKIGLTVKILPAAKGAYAIEFSPVKLTLPETERAKSLWFGDQEYRLHREDPKQKDLPLKTVENPAQGELRKAN